MGLFTARFLELLEEDGRGPIGQRFDLIAGTSVGGLIALGLAVGLSASQMRKKIEESGARVFPQGTTGQLGVFFAPWRPRCRSEPLEALATEILEERILDDLGQPVLVSSLNLTKCEARLFQTQHFNRGRSDGNVKLRDVAMATSAAPFFFAPRSIDGEMHVDGGLVANSPDALAVLKAIHELKWQSRDIRMLSVGTTLVPQGQPALKRGWGILSWSHKLRIVKTSIAAQMELSRMLARVILSPERLLVVDPVQSGDQAKHLSMSSTSRVSADTLKGLAQSEMRRLSEQCPTELAIFRTHEPIRE